MKNILPLMLLTTALTGADTLAATTLDAWGTLATISTYACVDEACDPVLTPAATALFLNTLSVDPIDGAVGQTSAGAATPIAWPSPGSAISSATVSSDIGIPILKAGAASTTNQWLAGQALAVQAYTYGGVGETLNLIWNLTGSITNPDADEVTGLVVFAGFFITDDALSFPDLADPFAVTTLFATAALVDPTDNVVEITAAGPVDTSGNISLTVSPGQAFYLVMGLMAGAGGQGAVAESLSTLAAEFVGSPALTPAFTPVPLPATLWLLVGALGTLVAARKRF